MLAQATNALRLAPLALAYLICSCSPQTAGKPPISYTNSAPANALTNAVAAAPATPAMLTEQVALEEQGGTLTVPVIINDAVKLKFTIDSGASDVVIPADVALTLVRSGTVTRDDYIGSRTFTLADGSEVPSPLFRIRSLKVGNLVMRNVEASLTNQAGSLLLGQSFLSRLSSWSIDNQRQLLVIAAPDGGLPAPTESPPTSVASVAPNPNWSAPPVQTEAPTQTTPTSPSGSGVGQNAGADVEDKAVAFYQTWSGNDAQSVLSVRPYFADTVLFYGSSLSLDELMRRELQFASRWPVRRYAVRPGTMTTSCFADGACMVSGLVDWSASSPADVRYSSGVAQFQFVFRDGLIVAESGRVVARN